MLYVFKSIINNNILLDDYLHPINKGSTDNWYHQNKRLNNPVSGNCKLTIAITNGLFLIIIWGEMKDAIVWKWWIWDPCWQKGQRSFYAKVLFSLALFLLYSIVWQLSPCTSATCQCSWYCATLWYRLQSITQ